MKKGIVPCLKEILRQFEKIGYKKDETGIILRKEIPGLSSITFSERLGKSICNFITNNTLFCEFSANAGFMACVENVLTISTEMLPFVGNVLVKVLDEEKHKYKREQAKKIEKQIRVAKKVTAKLEQMLKEITEKAEMKIDFRVIYKLSSNSIFIVLTYKNHKNSRASSYFPLKNGLFRSVKEWTTGEALKFFKNTFRSR